VEIYGPESSGKTTVALHAVANAQRAGGIAAFIDAEHALDPEYAKKLGVDTDALLVSQPDTGEQALEIMDMLIRSGAIVDRCGLAAVGSLKRSWRAGKPQQFGYKLAGIWKHWCRKGDGWCLRPTEADVFGVRFCLCERLVVRL
jgi:hypothetical protein